MSILYTDFDAACCEWLRELIAEGLIPAGDVLRADIRELKPKDVKHYVQRHYFAGIGGWPLALRIAGWPADRSIVSASCPCQPFSAAGKRKGHADERHLWPAFWRIESELRPERIIGEQVEAAIRLGWLDGISADLEAAGYAVGSVVLGAHSVGAPHIRQRLFWVADAGYISAGSGYVAAEQLEATKRTQSRQHLATGSMAGGLGDTQARGWRERGHEAQPRSGGHADGTGESNRLDNPIRPRLEGHAGNGDDRHEPGRIGADADRPASAAGGAGHWSDYSIIPCRDGKYRRIPTQPGLFPLAHGVSGRVAVVRPDRPETRYVSRTAALKGAGNAIVPQLAAEFIRAFMEIT